MTRGPKILILLVVIAGAAVLAWRLFGPGPRERYLSGYIEGESLFKQFQRNGVRARYQKNCRHALYSGGCVISLTDDDPYYFLLGDGTSRLLLGDGGGLLHK